jgi:hypothetical protein
MAVALMCLGFFGSAEENEVGEATITANAELDRFFLKCSDPRLLVAREHLIQERLTLFYS